MTVITLMAVALQRQLLDRRELFKFGLNTLPLSECEESMTAVLEESGKAAEAAISEPDMGKPS